MTAEPARVPPGVDTGRANIARVYDYWLGGSNNFQADRDLARALIAVEPNVRAIARANRACLGRAVRFMAAEGIRQFLDIGSGIPAGQNVHEVAGRAAPGARVVYADADDVAVAHSRLLLAGQPGAAIVHADLREPDMILSDPQTRRLIDFTQPVGLLLMAVLQFVPDADDPWRSVATIRDHLAPGSYLGLSHITTARTAQVGRAFETVYNSNTAGRVVIRDRAAITRFFDGFTLADPGVVYIPQWRPDSPGATPDDPSSFWGLAGVGRLGLPRG